MNARDKGLFNKFTVRRTDGGDADGEKHEGCEYFVLDLNHDKHAIPALLAYAESCAADYPLLAADLRAKVAGVLAASSEFVTAPETTLPNGTVVPSFQVARYMTSKGPAGIPLSNATDKPWTRINYRNAKKACEEAGLKLITELQCLAIAHDIAQQDINWSGGKVGDGFIFQGIHKGNVTGPQPGTFESSDPEERRWHQLSNGERIYDFAGNLYTWVFDDVQGDESGLIAKRFAEDSSSITSAPFPCMEKGVGWYPESGADWSGRALFRGGYWYSGGRAGVFYLGGDWPVDDRDRVGFRCTK